MNPKQVSLHVGGGQCCGLTEKWAYLSLLICSQISDTQTEQVCQVCHSVGPESTLQTTVYTSDQSTEQ